MRILGYCIGVGATAVGYTILTLYFGVPVWAACVVTIGLLGAGVIALTLIAWES